ncbi:hypothetical protein ACVWY9_000129 [Thermostichus sp. OS-CIW-31]
MLESEHFRLSKHALRRLQQRQEIASQWIERVLSCPDYVQVDPKDPQLKQAYGRIPEYGNRLLKIVYDESTDPWTVVTIFFDRTMGKKLP